MGFAEPLNMGLMHAHICKDSITATTVLTWIKTNNQKSYINTRLKFSLVTQRLTAVAVNQQIDIAH